MGTSIRADTVSREAVADAEKELSLLVDKLNAIRRRISDSVQSYQSLDKAIQHLEMEIAKSQKEVNLGIGMCKSSLKKLSISVGHNTCMRSFNLLFCFFLDCSFYLNRLTV